MRVTESSPMRIIALDQFTKKYRDLLTSRANIGPSEREFIEATYELLWFDSERKKNCEYKNWDKTVRATHYFLDTASMLHPDKLGKSFSKISNNIAPALNRTYVRLCNARSSTKNNDNAIEDRLSCYKAMYEGLTRLLLTPVIYSFSLVKNIRDNIFIPGSDGLINLRALDKMEKLSAYPEARLKVGLNKHVRNAYSHELYNILDDGKVKLWDIKPNNRTFSWGPEIWTIESLERLCDQLWFLDLAILYALTIYSINNRKTIVERGWWVDSEPVPIRESEFQMLVKMYSQKAGFILKNSMSYNRRLMIKLEIPCKGIDQDEEILFGGDKWASKFKRPVRYVETPVIHQVLGLLQRMKELTKRFDSIEVEVFDDTDICIGKAFMNSINIECLEGPNAMSYADAAKLFQVNSLGDAVMYYRQEGLAYEV